MSTKAKRDGGSNVEIDLDECILKTLDAIRQVLDDKFHGMPDVSNQALVEESINLYVTEHPEKFISNPVDITIPILLACKLEKCAALLQMSASEFIEYQCDLFLEASTGHFRMSVENLIDLPEDQKWLAALRVQQYETERGCPSKPVCIAGRLYDSVGERQDAATH